LLSGILCILAFSVIRSLLCTYVLTIILQQAHYKFFTNDDDDDDDEREKG